MGAAQREDKADGTNAVKFRPVSHMAASGCAYSSTVTVAKR